MFFKRAAKRHENAAIVVEKYCSQVAATERAIEQARVVDFDHVSKSVWKTLNVTHNRMKGSHTFEMSSDTADVIEICLQEINAGCPHAANSATKDNALETLRRMAQSICLSSGMVPGEVQKDYQHDDQLSTLMLPNARGLTDRKRVRLRTWCDDKLVELKGITDDCRISEGLDEVIDVIRGEEGLNFLLPRVFMVRIMMKRMGGRSLARVRARMA